MHVLFPGSLANQNHKNLSITNLFLESIVLKRVRWFANSDHQYMDNFKILQKAFAELQVKKVNESNRLFRF